MYTLLRASWAREALRIEAPSLVLSLLIAETFYKFHSFLLESIAFLFTWYVIAALAEVSGKAAASARGRTWRRSRGER